jgi:hypothetical protein
MKSKKLIIVLAVASALSVSACSKQQFVLESGVGMTAENSMSNFFVSGIGQTHRINASEVCGGKDKVVSVEAQTTFLNGLLGFLSTGLYSPRQYRIMCRT